MLKVTYIDYPGGLKERLIVTPLMDFVRQKRASKIGSQVHGIHLVMYLLLLPSIK